MTSYFSLLYLVMGSDRSFFGRHGPTMTNERLLFATLGQEEIDLTL